MNTRVIPIKGMHCRSCELLVEGSLKKIPGVKKANVSYRQGTAKIFSDNGISDSLIKKAIGDAGYEIGADQKEWLNKNPSEYKDLAIAFLLLLIIYLIFKITGLHFNFGYSGKPSNLAVVLLVGLTAGVSTCMALVGGLVLGIAARHSESHPEASPSQKFRPHLFFNLGRMIFFFLLGGGVGLIGKAFQLSPLALGMLTIVVGLVMLILGIQLTEIFPRVSSAGITLPSSISRLIGVRKHHEKEYSHRNAFLIGALTFFLPCGFTQAMQLYAMSSGSFLTGGLIMATFALGTAPGLLGVGGLTSIVKGTFARKFFKFAGLLVVALAILNISNGYNLTGFKKISFSRQDKVAGAQPDIKLEDGKQVVKMVQNQRGYAPNQFTIVKDIPVKWVIDSQAPGSCASSIVAPQVGVRRFLGAGENIIEFTPTQLGEIRFSCSMGMYTGGFTVIENTKIAQAAGTPSNSPTPTPSPSPSSPTVAKDAQVIRTTYVGSGGDIQPKDFTVTAGKPVHFEIYAQEQGLGCMGSITIPKLNQTPQWLDKGKTISFDFTPEKGTYYITCGMGAIRGKIIAN